MAWAVSFHDAFEPEFEALPDPVRESIAAAITLLKTYGPTLGRPHADTLAGSRYANMKELRFRAADGMWRVAYAFDPVREGIVLVAGDKSGVSQTRFYSALIAKADRRFTDHLQRREER